MCLFALCNELFRTEVLAIVSCQTSVAETFAEVGESEFEDVVGYLDRVEVFGGDGAGVAVVVVQVV
jgi:hypothetical protein